MSSLIPIPPSPSSIPESVEPRIPRTGGSDSALLLFRTAEELEELRKVVEALRKRVDGLENRLKTVESKLSGGN